MENEILEILKTDAYYGLSVERSAKEINERITEFVNFLLRHEGLNFSNAKEAYLYWIKHS